MTQNYETEVTSPCVRQCCLNADDICLGCFRHLSEITGWQNKTIEEKKDILVKCAKRQEQQ